MQPFYTPPEDKLNIQQAEIEELKEFANPFLEFVDKAGLEGPKHHTDEDGLGEGVDDEDY